MPQKMLALGIAITLIAVHAGDGFAASREDARNVQWKEWRDRESYKNPPPIFITVRGKRLFSASGHEVSLREVLRDLRALTRSAGHPVPVLVIEDGSTQADSKLMSQIERTGVCRDSACFFKTVALQSHGKAAATRR